MTDWLNDKIVDCVDVSTVCFYLHKRRLALGLSLGSSAGLPWLPKIKLGFILQQTVNARQGPLKGSQLGVPCFRQIPPRRWQGFSKLSALVLYGKGKDTYISLVVVPWGNLGVSTFNWDLLLSQLNTNSKYPPQIPHPLSDIRCQCCWWTWFEKIPHVGATKSLRHHREPVLRSPRSTVRSPCNEKPVPHNWRSLHSPKLEKSPHSNEDPAQPKIYIYLYIFYIFKVKIK